MPKTRTPPPLQPQGYEKSSNHIDVALTDTELLLWHAVFGKDKISDAIRLLVNKRAYELAGVSPADIPVDKLKLSPDATKGKLLREIQRHIKAMGKLTTKIP